MNKYELSLRGLNSLYERISIDGSNEVFYNKDMNNIIVIEPIDEGLDVNSVVNSIRESAYSHVINELNNNENIVVVWSQIEFTTSDYDIFYNQDIDKLKGLFGNDLIDAIYQDVDMSTCVSMKYREIKNNKSSAINIK